MVSGKTTASVGRSWASPPEYQFQPRAMRSTVAELLDGIGEWPNVLVLVRSFGPSTTSALKFALTDAGEWEPDPAGHYLGSGSSSLRFVRTRGDQRQRVRISLISEWLGLVPEGHTVPEMVRAFDRLRDVLRSTFDPGVMLWTTPVMTGRALWRRSIGHGKTFDQLDAETAKLIAETDPQGRTEMIGCMYCNGDGCPDHRSKARALFELDARLAYPAIARAELPGNLLAHDDRPWSSADRYQPNRYRVRARVPSDWRHVGILPLNDGGWRWPRTPGEQFETWADAAELHVADKHGWQFETLERLAFDKCRPLRTWSEKLCEPALTEPDPLVRRALRLIMLTTLGGMAQSPRMVTKIARDGQTMPPASARKVQHVDGVLSWQETSHRSTGYSFRHWATAIWARQRARLLDGPGETGALYLDPLDVVAFRTDAVWSTLDPGWPDDGKVGRYRVKQATAEASPWPHDARALLDMRGN